MQFFLKFADKKTLFLIDEFGVGTEPQFGGAIAQSILEDLNQKQAFGVITTHYSNLKQFADSTPGIVNAAMVFDAEHLEPLYQLKIGKPGSSYALEIAHKIGLPPKVIDAAKQLIGAERVSFDQMLNELEVDRKKYQELNQKVSKENKLLNQRVQEYQELKDYLEVQKKKIVEEAKEEARRLLAETNQQIEHTIRTIKESQADKQKTREARKNLEIFNKKVKPIATAPKRILPQTHEAISGPIAPGDYVLLPDRGAVGEVLSVKGEQAEISIGVLKSNSKLKRLEKISKHTFKKLSGEPDTKSYHSNIDLNQKLSGFSTNLDIRGKRAEEIFPIVETFVSEGNMFGFNELRIIHGKGDGILRKVVRDHLRQMNVVKAAYDEHVEQGGAGVTIVQLA
jgi:DNA mismatch repair protein MutS2